MRIAINILLFLLPFVLFFLYARATHTKRTSAGHDPLQTPWFWLLAVALVLAIAGFFVLRAMTDEHTGHYVPARMGPDGKLIPGHFEGEDHAPPYVAPPHQPDMGRPSSTPAPTP